MNDPREPFDLHAFHERIERLPYDDYFRLIAMIVAVHTGIPGPRPEAATLIEGIEAYADLLLECRTREGLLEGEIP